jgi:hypothetical protein
MTSLPPPFDWPRMVRDLAQRAGSQRALAREMDVHQSHLNLWATGKRTPSKPYRRDILRRWVEAFASRDAPVDGPGARPSRE